MKSTAPAPAINENIKRHSGSFLCNATKNNYETCTNERIETCGRLFPRNKN